MTSKTSTTVSKSEDKSARNEYARKYQAARNVAIGHLIAAHKDEFAGLLGTAKTEVGLVDGGAKRLENRQIKARKMLAELQAAGVDVSTLVG
jgi:hypothetical protein